MPAWSNICSQIAQKRPYLKPRDSSFGVRIWHGAVQASHSHKLNWLSWLKSVGREMSVVLGPLGKNEVSGVPRASYKVFAIFDTPSPCSSAWCTIMTLQAVRVAARHIIADLAHLPHCWLELLVLFFINISRQSWPCCFQTEGDPLSKFAIAVLRIPFLLSHVTLQHTDLLL